MRKNTGGISLGAMLVILAITNTVISQTGGSYNLSHSVIGSGGGSNSTGGVYRIDGTAGQALAGTTSTNGSYSLRGGFWAPAPLVPTASNVNLSGRVMCSVKVCVLRRVTLTLTDAMTGLVRTTQPNPFGYYRFEDLQIGRFYVISAEGGSLVFTPSSYQLTLLDDLTSVDFLAEPNQA